MDFINKPNYDYSQTLWMKMFLSEPDFENNRSEVFINFEQALEIIKAVDAITQGITKIIYLVGWQGLGHDDCYPCMDKVNEYLKRESDASGRDSFLWLFEEAKKYNTVVSVHGKNLPMQTRLLTTLTESPPFFRLLTEKIATRLHINNYGSRDYSKKSLTAFVRPFPCVRREPCISIISALRKV